MHVYKLRDKVATNPEFRSDYLSNVLKALDYDFRSGERSPQESGFMQLKTGRSLDEPATKIIDAFGFEITNVSNFTEEYCE